MSESRSYADALRDILENAHKGNSSWQESSTKSSRQMRKRRMQYFTLLQSSVKRRAKFPSEFANDIPKFPGTK